MTFSKVFLMSALAFTVSQSAASDGPVTRIGGNTFIIGPASFTCHTSNCADMLKKKRNAICKQLGYQTLGFHKLDESSASDDGVKTITYFLSCSS